MIRNLKSPFERNTWPHVIKNHRDLSIMIYTSPLIFDKIINLESFLLHDSRYRLNWPKYLSKHKAVMNKLLGSLPSKSQGLLGFRLLSSIVWIASKILRLSCFDFATPSLDLEDTLDDDDENSTKTYLQELNISKLDDQDGLFMNYLNDPKVHYTIWSIILTHCRCQIFRWYIHHRSSLGFSGFLYWATWIVNKESIYQHIGGNCFFFLFFFFLLATFKFPFSFFFLNNIEQMDMPKLLVSPLPTYISSS